MTTAAQIEALRVESMSHGDDIMTVICDLALGKGDELMDEGGGSLANVYTGMSIDSPQWRGLDSMTQEQAIAECAKVIRRAGAMTSSITVG